MVENVNIARIFQGEFSPLEAAIDVNFELLGAIVNFKDNLLGVNLLDRNQESIFYESIRTQWSGRRKFPCPRSLRKGNLPTRMRFKLLFCLTLQFDLNISILSILSISILSMLNISIFI